jgi:integrase
MPPRNQKKSKAEGLFKRCKHLSWDNCACPWWGRIKGQRVSLEKWSATPVPNKELAKKVLSRLEAAVLNHKFDKRGEQAALLNAAMTFEEFLDEYQKRHVVGEGLRSNSVGSYIEVFKTQFGEEKLVDLAANPYVFEKWLKDKQEGKKWANATFNRYLEHGRAMFNWAKARKLVTENPFEALAKKAENNSRDVRVSPDQESKLLASCDLLDKPAVSKLTKLTPEMVADIRARAESGEQIVNGQIRKERPPTLGPEMRRRLIGALDLGLRQGEMLQLQVKHVDFESWVVQLPAAITKAAVDQQVFAMTPRVQAMLTARKALGADAHVFGREDGTFVASFDKTWKKLFKLAGVPVGRKGGYVWHDLRHEYGSFLIEQGATIQEARELMRHADIRTTARYLKANDDRLKQLAGRMGQRLA